MLQAQLLDLDLAAPKYEMPHQEQGPDSLVVLAIVGSAADLVEIKTPAFLMAFRLQRFNQPTLGRQGI
ncbi:hypothetical protein RRF57_013367 [Xylaria bambusicola]|uniref:Uncharacterized protein n=1 Tax=Xylaria bambusicola TaxID=326684 RepID=A0AAN7ZBK3_9PEZI